MISLPPVPCKELCKLDTSFCTGFGRTLGEIAEWGSAAASRQHETSGDLRPAWEAGQAHPERRRIQYDAKFILAGKNPAALTRRHDPDRAGQCHPAIMLKLAKGLTQCQFRRI